MINRQILSRFLFCCLSCLCFYSTCSSQLHASEPAQPKNIRLGDYPTVVAYLNKLANYLVDEEGLAGLSIALINEQNIVWEKGFGFADKENKIKSGPGTVYQAGAVTGLLTSALIMRLVEQGKLGLDDDIQKYLPDLIIHFRETEKNKLKNHSKVITVRNLLTHHSGLPINIFKFSWAETPPSFHSLMSPSVKLETSYPPSTIYGFSNVGYSLLGLIVERVTGQSFSSAMQEYIFSPIKMNTSSVDNNSEIVKRLAVGYKDGDAGKKLLPRDSPSVGLATTAKDLSRFILMYFQKDLPGWQFLNETIQVQNTNIKLDIGRRVGFSWYVDGMNVQNAGPILWRGGTTPYYRSRVAMLSDHNLGIVVLSNDSKSWEVMSKISEKALQLMLEAKTGILQPDSDDEEKLKIVTEENIEPDEIADAYSGFVGHISFAKTGDDYRANVLGWSVILTGDQKSPGWFDLQYDLLGFIPIDLSWISGAKVRPGIVDGRRVLIVYYKGRQYLFAVRFEEKNIHSGWRNRTGEYQVKNSDLLLESMKVKKGELKLKGNSLFFVYQLPVWFGLSIDIPVETLSDTEAIIPGLGTGLNEKLTVTKINDEYFLEYSGYLLEKKKRSSEPFEFNLFD
ncbi:MAG: beta-lactamase family protein [Gammaproteobacteria bacterium]|nr:beta-lactamase family protein [Gammaproteobacteria bacterium]